MVDAATGTSAASFRLNDSRGGTVLTLGLGFVLGLASLAVYLPIFHNGFVNYDDMRYITQNPHIQSGLTWTAARWAGTAYYQSNWHPLTWISHALDISLFGLNPAGHHAINLLFHALNAVLLFLLLRDQTLRI